jgi:hypothetical protein
VLAYQNRVQNLVQGANCMLLPIQSAAAILPEWLLDMSTEPNFLTDLYDIIDPVLPNRGDWMDGGNERENYIVKLGVYHIAILNTVNKEALEQVLQQIPKNKRPALSTGLLDFFINTYPDFPLLLCCFENKDALQAAPIVLHYPPKFPDKLMVNALESHSGIPVVGKMVDYHQKIIFGSYKEAEETTAPLYRAIPLDFCSEFSEFMPKRAFGIDLLYSFRWGTKDIWVAQDTLHKGEAPEELYLGIIGNTETYEIIKTEPYNTLLRIRGVQSF